MTSAAPPPFRLTAASGLDAVIQRNGTLTWLTWRGLRINLYPGTALESGPANLWVRRRGATAAAHAVLGPASGSAVQADHGSVLVTGSASGVRYRAHLTLHASEPAWRWRIELTNVTDAPVEVDAVYAQDVGLARPEVIRTNEYYVSQYLDATPLDHPDRGRVVAVRQNLAQEGRHPWLVLGSLRRGAGFATDALQVHGLGARAGHPAQALGRASLPSTRLQHEHTLIAVQDRPAVLAAGASLTTGFVGYLLADHPEATSAADLRWVDRAVALFTGASPQAPEPTGSAPPEPGARVVRTLFDPPTLLGSRDLTDAEVTARYGADLRLVERSDDGAIASFFTSPRHHVVLRRKELAVLRPHGHLLRTGDRLLPDPRSLTTTTTMNGVVGSFVTQGQVAVNRFLSTARGYLGLQRAFGQRLFVEQAGRRLLLDVPSCYEMEPDHARWVYVHDGGEIAVTTTAPEDEHAITLEVRVIAGPPARFLAVHHVGAYGDDGLDPHRLDVSRTGETVTVTPHPESDVARRHPAGTFTIHLLGGARQATVTDDSPLFADGTSRDLPYLCLDVPATRAWGLRITGGLAPAEDPQPSEVPTARWPDLVDDLTLTARGDGEAGDGGASDGGAGDGEAAVERLAHQLPWLAHNALIHYLAPRGLEQYTGGAWGTRDVSQGPVELLLALGRLDALRALLPLVFGAQDPGGDWPQSFGFTSDDLDFRMGPSHGDVVLWPVLALGRYLLSARDASVLDEVVAFFPGDDGAGESASVLAHALRALEVAASRTVGGTHLTAYGHGDWNDSLQPADLSMPAHLCSSWTVTLHVQALRTLAAGLEAAGRENHVAALHREADSVVEDFQRYLVQDGVLAGYVFFADDGSRRYLIHPSDRDTGLTYSLLPMIHAVISDMLTPDQVRSHLALIRAHLLAPDGARLFDRPPAYRGGPMVHFQRAETATFFGREIGLMYTHAHLRWAEALAHLGLADDLVTALEQANPIGIRDRLPTARPRQDNVFYSSSDAAFGDRYQARAEYHRVLEGTIDVEGGWRVYSSGAGIAYRLVVEGLLGLRRGAAGLVVDPVLPPSFDGLEVRLRLAGRLVTVTYRVGPVGSGVAQVLLNGTALEGTRLPNPYRTGGLELAMRDVVGLLEGEGNTLEVVLS